MRGSAFFTAFLFCVLLASTASGQASSSLRGKVIDAQGGFMPGVALRIVNTQTARTAMNQRLYAALRPGGHVIIASFSLDGPLSCSGLDVARYSSETLGKELGTEFSLVESFTEDHETPSGKIQKFVYCRFMG